MSDKVMIGGVPVDVYSRDSLADQLARDVTAPLARPKLVFSANGQGISMAVTDQVFARDLEQADIVHADGMSIVFASRVFTRTHLPERIATTDFFHDAARVADKKRLKFFFLGAKEEVVRDAYAEAQKMYPNVDWVGFRNGYFTEDEEEQVCREIVATGADVVWVGIGRPKQEAFCVRNADRLAGVTWLKTCGGLFDFLAGRNSRAPSWMQSLGLEWAYRTLLEPRRLLWRYVVTNTHCLWLFLTKSGSITPAAPHDTPLSASGER